MAGSPPRANAGRLSAAGSKAGSKVGSAPCNPPPIGWQALIAGPRGDCVALMRPADALAFPCGKWCGYRKHKKTGGRVRLPVSCVLAMFSGLVLESAPCGGCPYIRIFKYGKARPHPYQLPWQYFLHIFRLFIAIFVLFHLLSDTL